MRKNKITSYLIILSLISLLLSCDNNSSYKFVSTNGSKFIDSQGQQILFHGVNLVNKNPEANYIGDYEDLDFARLQDWGFNCIRLGIIWDGLEPQPGVYDEAYLKKIDGLIHSAKKYNLYILLDMHQDLYSRKFSDGAPEWATLTDDQPHIADGPLWSDAYFTSPAVQAALDNFWNNSPAPDGVGIQDHYARAWAHVAERYANEPDIIGYDIMNEPFPGKDAIQAQLLLFSEGAKVLAELENSPPMPIEQLIGQWMDVNSRFKLLQILSDVKYYSRVVDAARPVYADFEKSKLMPMYQRVADHIRRVDKNHILFLEASMGSNTGVYSGIYPLVTADGSRDERQAYAPHGYDLVTDMPQVDQANEKRIEFIFGRHGQKRDELDMPMLVGEWGAYGHSKALNAARVVVKQFERLLCSDTFWDHDKDMDERHYFPALQRPYPQNISGSLLSYYFDNESNIFECIWQEDASIKSPSRLYVPNGRQLSESQIILSPEKSQFSIKPVQENSANIVIEVGPCGSNMQRQLKVDFN